MKSNMLPAAFLVSLAVLFALAFSAQANALCMIDVYGLDVIGNTIHGSIKNTGNQSASVRYELWIRKEKQDPLIRSGVVDLNSSEVRQITHEYTFGYGSYSIMLNATASCGFEDMESMGHMILDSYRCAGPYGMEDETRCDYASRKHLTCDQGRWITTAQNTGDYCYDCPYTCGDGVCNCGEDQSTCRRDCESGQCNRGYLDEYRCVSNVLQRRYRHSDCTEDWSSVETCVQGCSNNQCIGGANEGCGVAIRSFDYISFVTEQTSPYVKVAAENTGNLTGTLTITLRVGDVVKSYSATVSKGQSAQNTFEFARPANPGTYAISVEVASSCGASDAVGGTLVYGQQGGAVQTPPAVMEPPKQLRETGIDVYPAVIDFASCQSKVITLDIESSTRQTFVIRVQGAPEEWLDYPQQVEVDGHKTVYIYATPDRAGKYELVISADPKTEGGSFSRRVDMYVAPGTCDKKDGTAIGYAMDQAAKLFEAISKNVWAVVALVIIALIVVFAIGRKQLKSEYEGLMHFGE